MTLLRSLAAAAFVSSLASTAWADMPGGTHCDAPSECTVCSRPETGGGGATTAFDACRAQAETDGFHLSCSDFTGSDENEYWCPAGVDATEVTSDAGETDGGSSSGCTVSGRRGAERVVIAAGLLFAGVVMALRRRAPSADDR